MKVSLARNKLILHQHMVPNIRYCFICYLLMLSSVNGDLKYEANDSTMSVGC